MYTLYIIQCIRPPCLYNSNDFLKEFPHEISIDCPGRLCNTESVLPRSVIYRFCQSVSFGLWFFTKESLVVVFGEIVTIQLFAKDLPTEILLAAYRYGWSHGVRLERGLIVDESLAGSAIWILLEIGEFQVLST